jgi:hypothetical protein
MALYMDGDATQDAGNDAETERYATAVRATLSLELNDPAEAARFRALIAELDVGGSFDAPGQE